jgi:predicted glycoside hydrolase/deacetylase ChbG (UPF0249 family)
VGASFIINADDLGRSVEVNAEIFRLVEKGKVTSATVIATGEAIGDCAHRAKSHSGCSFGVHLFLDEFRPVTDLANFPAVLEADGRFRDNARGYVYDAALRHAFAREWVAQVRRVQEAGIRVSHLDSHHHIHTFPAVFPILKRVQSLTGVSKVRCSLNSYGEPRRIRLLLKWVYNTALRHCPPTVTTDYFMPFGIFCGLSRRCGVRVGRTYELMVHPAAGSYMTEPEAYEAEIRELEADWEQVLPGNCRFISYHELN